MLSEALIKEQVVDVVYNLYELAEELFLPNAFVVSKDHEGLLAHIQQRATPATIGAFELELDPVREKLFTLIAELEPENLVKHFYRGKRKSPGLEDLIQDRDTLRAVQRYVHRRLDQMLQLIVHHDLPLSWNVERRVLVKDFLVAVHSHPLRPELYFNRTESGVDYQLRLYDGDRRWTLTEREVAAVTNEPGWLIADYRLYRLDHINGFLIKPFRQRETVKIPAASVKAYFRNFILKIVNKVEVAAEGFSVHQFNELQGCELEPVQHLFDDRWVLQVQMRYHNARFGWQETRPHRTTLEMNGGEDEVRILQVRRDFAAEKAYLEKLGDFDLLAPEGQSHYQLADGDAQAFALIEWLGKHRSALEQAGFTVVPPRIDDQRLSLQIPEINMEVATGNDWFDLKGTVVVGEHRFPFLALAKHIREDNRFYPLPDGSIFLIPEEWMTRYRHLASFGRKEGGNLRITKSQYTLLDALDIQRPKELSPDDVTEYQPSPLLKAQLRPYQLEGVRWLTQLYHQELGACLADDMGLGKTLQTIALLLFAKEQKAKRRQQENAGERPSTNGNGQLGLFLEADDADFLQPLNALIVLPASLLYNWESEVRQFAPSLSVYQHFGPKRHRHARLLARFDLILTTYQTALRDLELLRELTFEYIVLDESQQIKNRDSKVFKAINQLAARHKISLSGTPIENSLSDLWSQMQFINPNLLGSYPFFRREFINPIEKAQDDTKKERLRQLVRPYLLRRTKEEVAKDLPPLSTRVFFSEMTKEQRKLYEKEKSAARNYLLENFSASDSKYRIMVVQTLTKLRQLANHPILLNRDYDKDSGKFQDVIEQWDIIRRGGHKVLLFSSFVQHLELFRAHLEAEGQPYAWLTGNLNAQQRQAEIEKFQREAPVQSFFISIKTGGTGLNLTAADYVFILDPWWNPTTERQAIARAHRIGQDKSVIATKFITHESIEEKILQLQDRKSRLAEDIIGNTGKFSLDKRDLEYLLG